MAFNFKKQWKKNIVFLFLILSEIIFAVYYYKKGGPPNTCSLLKPFCFWFNGILTPQVMVIPHYLFYIIADLLILTVMYYLISFLVSSLNRNK